jgi:hypothetical protein
MISNPEYSEVGRSGPALEAVHLFGRRAVQEIAHRLRLARHEHVANAYFDEVRDVVISAAEG